MNWWQTQLSCIYHVNVHNKYFVVYVLHVSCCRLIQPVEMYTNCYMMWYLKKDMFCKEHIFSDNLPFLKRSVRHPFCSRSGRRPSSSRHVPRGSRSCTCAYFIRTWNFRIVYAIVFSDRISRSRARSYERSFLVGPGFEPLALHAIFFVGPGFDSLTLQHNLFVDPGFDSRTRSPVFRPVVSVAYVMHKNGIANRHHQCHSDYFLSVLNLLNLIKSFKV